MHEKIWWGWPPPSRKHAEEFLGWRLSMMFFEFSLVLTTDYVLSFLTSPALLFLMLEEKKEGNDCNVKGEWWAETSRAFTRLHVRQIVLGSSLDWFSDFGHSLGGWGRRNMVELRQCFKKYLGFDKNCS